MRRGFIGAAKAAVVLVTACTAMVAMGKQTVGRDVHVSASGDGCTIANDIPDITVPRGDSATITWTLRPQGGAPANDFKFDSAKGIDFKGAGDFRDTDKKDKTWTVNDSNKTQAKHKYEVNVVRESSGKSCPLDPTVNNDGGCTSGCDP